MNARDEIEEVVLTLFKHKHKCAPLPFGFHFRGNDIEVHPHRVGICTDLEVYAVIPPDGTLMDLFKTRFLITL